MSAGFGWFQVLLLLYAGLAWAADAMEMMLLSFLGPAVRCDWGLSATQVQSQQINQAVCVYLRQSRCMVFWRWG